MLKFKVLKDFISTVVTGVKDAIHELELDEPTAKMWIEHGLIEEVKEPVTTQPPPQDVPPRVDQSPEPVSETVNVPTDASAEPVPDTASAADTAPADVTADETK